MTSVFGYIPQSDSPLPLESGFPDDFHFLQAILLYFTFQPPNWNPDLVYSAAGLNLYYDVNHSLWYKRPDWFGVVGVGKLYQGQDFRLSYVKWQESANPFVVVELLSPGTEDEDLGEKQQRENKPPTKWKVYEEILRVPYYIVFSRYTNEVKPYHLVGGRYKAMNINSDGRLDMPALGLSLGLWEGAFQGIDRLWLRWFTLEGELIQTPEERAESAEQKVIEAEQKAAEEKIKAEKFAEQLRQLGINPDEIK